MNKWKISMIKFCKNCHKEFKTKKRHKIYCNFECYIIYNKEELKLQFKKYATNEDGRPYNYDYYKIRNCITCGKKLHHCSKTGYCAEHYHTDVYKKKMSNSIKNAYETGTKVSVYSPKCRSNKYRKGYYKGYWCDSSWELAYIIYNLENNISFKRNTESFNYQWENKIRKWFPDFLENSIYIEIKGYITNKNLAKWKDFKLPLKILQKKEMKCIIDYVESKYGKDFYKLYETNSSKSSVGMRAVV